MFCVVILLEVKLYTKQIYGIVQRVDLCTCDIRNQNDVLEVCVAQLRKHKECSQTNV